MFYCVRYFCVNQPFSPEAEDETFEVSEYRPIFVQTQYIEDALTSIKI